MNRLFLFAISILLISCNDKLDEANKSTSDVSTVYIDKPFVQEVHEGFIVNKNDAGANDVIAIKPYNSKKIWIANKNGVYQK